MKPNHLSEAEIQQYALQPRECPAETISHIQSCPDCRSRANTYKVVFLQVRAMEVPGFDFDLPGLVMSSIQRKRATGTFPLAPLVMILTFSIVLVIIVFFLMSRKDLAHLWKNGNHLPAYTFLTGGILVIVFHVTDIALQARKQVKKYDLE